MLYPIADGAAHTNTCFCKGHAGQAKPEAHASASHTRITRAHTHTFFATHGPGHFPRARHTHLHLHSPLKLCPRTARAPELGLIVLLVLKGLLCVDTRVFLDVLGQLRGAQAGHAGQAGLVEGPAHTHTHTHTCARTHTHE